MLLLLLLMVWWTGGLVLVGRRAAGWLRTVLLWSVWHRRRLVDVLLGRGMERCGRPT